MKRILAVLIIAFVCINNDVYAQRNLMGYGFNSVPTSVKMNPATRPDAAAVIGVPGLNFQVGVNANNFTFGDIIREQGDSTIIDGSYFIDQLDDSNYFAMTFEDDILFGGFELYNEDYLTFGWYNTVEFNVFFPKDLMGVAWYGNNGQNGSYLGRLLNFKESDLSVAHYNVFHVGLSRVINKQWTVGARLKYIQGLSNIDIERFNVSIQTDPDAEIEYSTAINSDFLIRTSGMSQFGDEGDGVNLVNFSNFGFGIDLGAEYYYDDRWKFSASLVDVGFIRWSDDVENYRSLADATYNYQGLFIDLDDDENNSNGIDSLETRFDNLVDDLKDVFDVDTVSESYVTSLSTKVFLAGEYRVNERGTASALYNGYKLGNRFKGAMMLSYTYAMGKKKNISLKASYIRMDNTNSIGLGTSMNIGKVNVYMLTDNILALPFARDVGNFNLAFGLNIKLYDPKPKRLSKTRWDYGT